MMKIERLCDGLGVYYMDRPVGENLQGWYKTFQEADTAAAECVALVMKEKKK